MVKFMIPGKRNSVNIGGHFFAGGMTYDNNLYRLPEDEIKPFIIKEHGNVLQEDNTKKEIDKKVEAQDKEITNVEKTRDEQKQMIKDHYTLKDLKSKAKEMGLKVPFNITEDKLVDTLLDNGFKA